MREGQCASSLWLTMTREEMTRGWTMAERRQRAGRRAEPLHCAAVANAPVCDSVALGCPTHRCGREHGPGRQSVAGLPRSHVHSERWPGISAATPHALRSAALRWPPSAQRESRPIRSACQSQRRRRRPAQCPRRSPPLPRRRTLWRCSLSEAASKASRRLSSPACPPPTAGLLLRRRRSLRYDDDDMAVIRRKLHKNTKSKSEHHLQLTRILNFNPIENPSHFPHVLVFLRMN